VGEILGTGARGSGLENRVRRLVLAGGTLWDEEGGRRADILVEGERIAAVGDLSAADHGAHVIDVSGLHLLPGLIDAHVHVADRVGGLELADDFGSASDVAVCNGVTSFFTFVTQRGGETLAQAVERVEARLAGHSRCDVGLHLTPTGWPWDWNQVSHQVERGHRTFKLYTTYREAGLYTDYTRLEEVMRGLTRLGARLLVHCEDEAALAEAAGAEPDPGSATWHARLRPEAVETTAIARVVELSDRTGCPVHVVHVSTESGLEVVERAAATAQTTCETAPHYLLLDESALAKPGGHRWLCTPPLRSSATRAAMEAAAAASRFDLFATDHCPFRAADKDRAAGDAGAVPKGLPGLGALVPVLHDLLVTRHGLPLSELARRLAANPARLTGTFPRKGVLRPGSDADVVALDPGGPPRPVRSTRAPCHDPWSTRTTRLAVRLVVRRGEVVVLDGAVAADSGRGGRLLLAS
jgi:dihydropyrimidinase